MKQSWLGLCVVSLLGCSGPVVGEACGTYQITVAVTGTEAAFEGRQIEVQGHAMPAAEETSTGQWRTFGSFCTNSQDAFLNRQLQVRVLSEDTVVSDVMVDRACRYVELEGKNLEENHLALEQDGTVSEDLQGSGCMATCSVPSACEDDLFD